MGMGRERERMRRLEWGYGIGYWDEVDDRYYVDLFALSYGYHCFYRVA